MTVPSDRLLTLTDAPLRPSGEFVLYWMTSFRRAASNFALDRALEHARALRRPLLVLEALRLDYPFASERLHAFVLQGMADNQRAFTRAGVGYLPFVETSPGAGHGLLEALAARACVVVGDDWPCLFVPRMQAAAAARLAVRFEVVDANGLFPLRATTRTFSTAHSFRAHLQKELPRHLGALPAEAPLEDLRLPALADLPGEVARRWPAASPALLAADPSALASLPIDHAVPPVARRGGAAAAAARLALFVEQKLEHYDSARNEPELDGTSALSPWLHFGHLSTHQVFSAIARQARWSPAILGRSRGGAKEGWWGLPPGAEAFLDELVTWRELAFNAAAQQPVAACTMASLPAWAKQTIAAHAADPRPGLATLAELEGAATADPLWNAAQRQLVREGWFHNVLRMLWGKKIYEWSPSAGEALARMEHLMGRYALDGRDPVSWGGYLWVLGRADRAWGPERPIFGKLRYMTSQNLARKVSVKRYLERYAP